MNQARENSVDMIFADPPYFFSNGSITCHAGKMVSVNKGKWDKSKGIEENHKITLDFKHKQYLKLIAPLGIKVEYVYVLSDWFKKLEYKDVLDYIHSVNCRYKSNLNYARLYIKSPMAVRLRFFVALFVEMTFLEVCVILV